MDLLLIGYGNPGRLDDGLGPALAERIENRAPAGVTVDSDYQLTVEDAAQVAQHAVVVFADADETGPEPFSLRPIAPAAGHVSFSTHSISPQAVLALAQELFGARPQAWLLGIRGYEFNEFGQRLSEAAQANLDQAERHLLDAIAQGRFEPVRARGDSPPQTASSEGNEDDPCKTENT